MQWTVTATFCTFPVLHAVLALVLSWVATVADFVIILQLYCVKTQARPTPLRSNRAIKLPSCHIASSRLAGPEEPTDISDDDEAAPDQQKLLIC